MVLDTGSQKVVPIASIEPLTVEPSTDLPNSIDHVACYSIPRVAQVNRFLVEEQIILTRGIYSEPLLEGRCI